MAYTIWVTGACNLKCKYCYEGKEKSQKNMTKEIAEATINFIEKDFDSKEANNELLINFHGGEPFLNFEIIQFFITSLKNKYNGKCKVGKVGFTVTTNATLLNAETIKYIVDENIDVSVSLDGDKYTHDLMRQYNNGHGSHEVVMKNAIILLESLEHIRISLVYNSETVALLSENIDYLIKSGFNYIAAGNDSFDKRWEEKHLEILKQEVLKIKELLNKYPTAHVSICEKLHYCGEVCKGGILNKHIYYDGGIYPCVVTGGNEEFLIGTIFNGIDMDKRQKLLNHSGSNNTECIECDLKGYCKTFRCTLINRIITGSYTEPVPMDCFYTQLVYKMNGIEDCKGDSESLGYHKDLL